MGTHVIWRNPCPPPRVRFKLRRLTGSERGTIYQIVSPNYRRPFELVRTVWRNVPMQQAEPYPGPRAAELVLARW